MGAFSASAQDQEPYEQSPIHYSTAEPHDAVSQLQTRIAAGHVQFGSTDPQTVRSLLKELRIPVESQVLVFSKTSLQRQRIRPDHPRSLFFNDTCYLGWVPGGLVEITTIDPIIGPVFYAVDPAALRTNALHGIARDSDCLRCHGGTFVRGIPGVFVRSVFPDESGEPLFRQGSELVDFRTPFTNRWGGWYVTGRHGDALHRGNVLAREKDDQLDVDFHQGANVKDLSRFFDVHDYLTNTSDIVALLMLEHQTALQNVLTQASISSRHMLEYQTTLQRELKEPVSEEPAYDSVKRVFDSLARDVVDNLLFRGEAELPSGLAGSPAFQQAAQAGVPKAHDGSSLREFCLEGHLFKNRCSSLIYSDSLLQLPAPLKRRIYDRLARALRPVNPDARYAYLGAAERSRITTILRDTHQELRAVLGPSS